MKVKTQIVIAAVFVSALNIHLLLHAESIQQKPGSTNSSSPDSQKSTPPKGQFTTGGSSDGTEDNRNFTESTWEDFTTPLIAGVNHENHRGSAWCDYDNDGLLDLYITHFGLFNSDGEYFGSANQLFRNLGEDGFEDVTTYELEAQSGLSHHAAWADIDNDGLPDMYISQSSNSGIEFSVLLHHDSTGSFSNITSGDPLAMDGMLPRGIGWQDVNNDGFVDLLIANSNGDTKKNRLLINTGNNEFILQESVFAEAMRESRSIGWCDYNNDNLPDVYIANGAEDHADVFNRTNQLFKNVGDGTWVDVAEFAGVDDVGHGRGQVWGDINNDGYLDLFVGNQKGSDTGGGHNRMYKNNGDGTFTVITNSAGLLESFRTRCVSMADYNNDGFLDIYIVNFGNATPPNHLYRNNGNNTFTEVAAGTLATGGPGNGSSATWADFDNDGWIDLYIVGGSTESPGEGMNRLLRNANQNGNHWLEVELCGTISNRTAIGARVSITHRNAFNQIVSQMREIQNGSGYNSAHMLRAHFGVGQSDEILDITIRWPSGIVQTISNQPVDKIIRVVEDYDFAFDCNRNCIPDYKDILDCTSLDENFNGIPDECDCWGDLNGDGVVEVNDIMILIMEWGSTTSVICDLNGDGVVEVNDLIILISAWGSCT